MVRQLKKRLAGSPIYNILLLSLVFLIPFFLFTLFKPSTSEAAWFDNSWSFRQRINIPTHTSLETNVYVTVPSFDATDTDKFQSDCGDLRFTKENGQLLKYYIVDCDATANIHVLFDSLPAGETNYYMYYGNPSAPNGFESSDFATAATGLGSQTAASEENGPGPIVYWKFDEGQGSTLNNSTTVSANGSISGATWQAESMCINGRCLFFDGTNDVVTIANTVNPIQTVSFWVRLNSVSTTEQLLDLNGTDYLQSVSGTVTANGFGTETIYVDGKASTTLQANQWHYVTVTTSSALSGSAIKLGQISSNYGQGYIDEVKFYSYARSASQIQLDFVTGSSAIGSAAVLGQADTAFLTNGLVGYWKMDESSRDSEGEITSDSSGNAHHGTLYGDNSTGDNGTGMDCTSLGKYGTGCEYDGTDDYVSIADTDALDLSTAYSFAFWVRSPNSSDTNAIDVVTFKKASTTLNRTNYSFNWSHTNDTYDNACVHSHSGVFSTNIAQLPSALAADTWYHITCVYDGNTLKAYLNGNLVATDTSTSSPDTGGGRFVIGAGVSDADANVNNFFQGKVDEYRLYNRALSSKEINNLYNWAPGPIAYYNFDEGQGNSTLKDISGNGLHGTMYNINGSEWVPGKFGQALAFNNGTSDRVVNIGVIDSKFNGSYGSAMAWARVPSWTGIPEDGNIFNVFADGSNRLFINTRPSGDLQYGYIAGGTSKSLFHTVGIPGWHHVAITWNKADDTVVFYLNGAIMSRETALGTWSGSLNAVWNNIGSNRSDFPGYSFLGVIDEVKFYDYARTPSQIIEDMNGGHPVGSSGSQTVYWSFDEGTGTTANNSVNTNSSVLSGTITSATWLQSDDCRFYRCLNFSATSHSVSAGDVSFVDGAVQMSWSLWLNPQSLATDRTIISKTNHSNQNNFLVRTHGTNSDEVNVYIASSASDTSNYYTTTNLNLSTEAWQHLLVVYDGTQTAANRIRIYKNGTLVEGSITGTIPATLTSSTTSTLRVGNSDISGDESLVAYIDEVKIYSAALSSAQALVDYNFGSVLSASVGVSEAATITGGMPALTGQWDLNENTGTSTTADLSGNSLTGTLNSITSSSWVLGKSGSALDLDGNADYVQIADNALLDFNTGSTYSYSFWIKPDSMQEWSTVWSQTVDSSSYFLVYAHTSTTNPWIVTSGISVGLYDGSAVATRTSNNNVISIGKWSHITITYDGSLAAASRIRIYVDGIDQTGTGTGSGGTSTLSIANTRIGANQPFGEYYNGAIDEVRFYSAVLTPAQIAYNYNRGRPVGWWKFDECQGTTLYDSSGNSSNGTWTGTGAGTQTAVGTCNTSGTAWGNGASGKFNASLNFDGNDDVVGIADNAILDLANDATWAAWINLTANSGIKNIIQKDANNGYAMYVNAGKLSMLIYPEYDSGDTTMSTGTWYHVAVTKTGTTVTFYVNGNVDGVSTGTFPSAIPTNAVDVGIGARASDSLDAFNGKIDDVRIYNYGLSRAQILQLMNDGSSVRFGP